MNKVQEAGVAYAVYQKVKSLPASEQTEVLRFVDYMLYRSSQEDRTWMELAIREALRGIEDDVWPDYDAKDLQEDWACDSQDR